MGQLATFKVLVGVVRGEKSVIYTGDLIFIDREPHLVFEWAGSRDERQPLISVALDRANLQSISSLFGGDYVYRRPVNAPVAMRWPDLLGPDEAASPTADTLWTFSVSSSPLTH